MDEQAYRETYQALGDRPCVFEKALLSRLANCACAQRFCIAEREGVNCRTAAAHSACLEFLDAVRDASRFLLHETGSRPALGHNRAMAVQIGGLRGLHRVLRPEENDAPDIGDIHSLVASARDMPGLDALPWQTIVREVAAYRPKRRSRQPD
jgi:hypothetical protein